MGSARRWGEQAKPAGRPPLDGRTKARIFALHEEHPELGVRRLAARVTVETGVSVSRETVRKLIAAGAGAGGRRCRARARGAVEADRVERCPADDGGGSRAVRLVSGCGGRVAGRVVLDVPVSRCRTCGRDAERVLSSAEVLRVVWAAVDARSRHVPVLDYTTAMIPGRLAALQVIEAMAALLDRREFVREELGRELEVAELDELFEEPAAGSEGDR